MYKETIFLNQLNKFHEQLKDYIFENYLSYGIWV